MTVILPFGRGLTRHIVPRSNQLLTRLASSNPLLRGSYSKTGDTDNTEPCRTTLKSKVVVRAFRSYATTATSKPSGRPKAHTGRTAAKKPKAKTAKDASTKTRSTKKTVSKAKPKRKPKTKARAQKKPSSATAVNRARVAKNKDLKIKALLPNPKKLPANSWGVYFSQRMKNSTGNITETSAKVKEVAQAYKQLSLEEREQLNHVANQNEAKNNADYKKWVSQYTPVQVREANNARNALNREKKVKDGKKKAVIPLIKDDRLVKHPASAYNFFYAERFKSGDFKHMTVVEAAKLAGREWKALDAFERKQYEEQAEGDRNRYVEEFMTVYGKEPPTKKSPKAK